MDGSLAALLIAVLIIMLSVYRAHVGPSAFDLTDLLKENGRVSKIAVAFMLTLVVTSWLMIHLALKGQMSEGYLGLYGSLWITPIVARIIKGSPPSEKEA